MNYSWDHKINRILNYIAIDDTSQGRCYPSLVRLDRLTSQNMVLINLYFDILRGSQWCFKRVNDPTHELSPEV